MKKITLNGTTHTRIDSVDELKRLASADGGVECFIALMGCRSSKHVAYFADTDEWYILNEMDETEDTKLDDTNIPKAIDSGNFYMYGN